MGPVDKPEEDLLEVEVLPRAVEPAYEPEEDLLVTEAMGEREEQFKVLLRPRLQQPGGWPQAAVVVLAVLGLRGQ